LRATTGQSSLFDMRFRVKAAQFKSQARDHLLIAPMWSPLKHHLSSELKLLAHLPTEMVAEDAIFSIFLWTINDH
jgi:hypothetical protein